MKLRTKTLMIFAILLLVLLSTSVSALSKEETVSALSKIFDELGTVETGIDDEVLPLLQRFKSEYSMDGVSVDQEGDVYFEKQYNMNFLEGVEVYYDSEEEKLLRSSTGENIKLFSGNSDSLGYYVEYDFLSMTYSGVIEYPIEVVNLDGMPSYVLVTVGPGTEARIISEDENKNELVLANVANPSEEEYQDYALIPIINNFFTKEFSKSRFGEPVLLQSTKVDFDKGISPDKYLGKDYSMYDIIQSFSEIKGQGENTVLLDAHGLSRKGLLFKQNNTIYEFGSLNQHQRFLYPKLSYGNQINIYSESLQGDLITYAIPSFIIADDGYAYNLNYSSIISGKEDIIIIDLNLGYIYKDDLSGNNKGDSQIISLLTTPAKNPLVFIKTLYDKLGLSSHQYSTSEQESKNGKMQLHDQLYEGDFIERTPTGMIFYDNMLVGTHYTGDLE